MPFRRHRRTSWVALIAIAVQLVLCFGHVHAYRHPHPATLNSLSTANADQGAGQPEELDGSCALCWLTRAAGTLVLPEFVSAPVRMALWQPPAPTPGMPRPCSNHNFAFRARAPPMANR
jgi:hypothetical protein